MTARLSQSPIEVVVIESAAALLSQAVIEVVGQDDPPARCSQVVIEIVAKSAAKGRMYPPQIINRLLGTGIQE